MQRGVIAILTIGLLLSGCRSKVTPAVVVTPSPVVSTVSVILTFQGTLQPNVTVTESATYNYATNTPGAAVTAGVTNSAGTVALSVGNPAVPYCFSASYTPAGQTTAVNVVNCQPTITIGQTITLGN